MLLGINEGINSSVTLFDQGKMLFALQEERICREKNFTGFPIRALEFLMLHTGLTTTEIRSICLSNRRSPTFNWQDFQESYNEVADNPAQSFTKTKAQDLMVAAFRKLPGDAQKKAKQVFGRPHTSQVEEQLLKLGFRYEQIVRADHHLLHAATAYYGMRKNPEDPHLVVTLDGGGDGHCSQVYIGRNGTLELLASTPVGNSVGNIYSWVTHFMGMKPHEHEYKLMGLSAYRERDKYTKSLINIFDSYLGLDPDQVLCFKRKTPERTYDIQARLARDFKRARFDNLAAALQFWTEDLLVRWIRACVESTGIRNVVCAGGVFMNVKANRELAQLDCLDFFDVFPSCGDETLSLGAVWNYYAGTSKTRGDDIVFDTFCLGPEADFDLAQAREAFSDRLDFSEPGDIDQTVASLLSDGHIVARCSGPMEFGARALGNRSILAKPDNFSVIPEINKMIKGRDFWMPFAPAILEEDASEYLEIPSTLPVDTISPYMMHSFMTRPQHRESITAGIHAYDKSARAQIVTERINPGFHRLLQKFKVLSGSGVLLNTSFNLHGFPIVTGAKDAMDVMLNSSLQYLVVGNTLVTKQATSEKKPQ